MNRFEIFEAKKTVTPQMVYKMGAIQPSLSDIQVADDERVRVFDVEVFEHQSCVVFKKMDGTTDRIFTNNVSGLNKYVAKGLIQEIGYKGLENYIKDKILIGFNNYHYDDYILNAMVCHSRRPLEVQQQLIKATSDSIINRTGEKLWRIHQLPSMRNMVTLDAMQEISGYPSLKKIEANMGISIKESDVPFDIKRPLNDEENLSVIEYCEYDVYATSLIAKRRQYNWTERLKVLDMIEDHPKNAYRWGTTSIIGMLLTPKYKPTNMDMSVVNLLHHVPSEVQDMWREIYEKPVVGIDFKPRTKSVKIQEFGCDVVFAWGGLHGAPKGYTHAEDVKLLDVNSMYPNIIILLNGLGDKTGYYKDILDYRFKLKKEGRKIEQLGYKLILNRVSGCFQYKYSTLCNVFLALNMRIFGQIAIYALAKKLHNAGANIINLNTDGVGFTGLSDAQIQDIQTEWENEFKLELGLDEFDEWWQTGVNGYIAKEKGTDKVKCKGADTNRVFSDVVYTSDNIRICQIALFEYIVNNVPVYETLTKNLDKPVLYQYVLACGPTFKGTYDKQGNQYNKVNRVFASKEHGTCLYKVKEDATGLSYCQFPDAPQNMIVWNDDVDAFTDFKNKVDLQYYYDITMKNLKRWQ